MYTPEEELKESEEMLTRWMNNTVNWSERDKATTSMMVEFGVEPNC